MLCVPLISSFLNIYLFSFLSFLKNVLWTWKIRGKPKLFLSLWRPLEPRWRSCVWVMAVRFWWMRPSTVLIRTMAGWSFRTFTWLRPNSLTTWRNTLSEWPDLEVSFLQWIQWRISFVNQYYDLSWLVKNCIDCIEYSLTFSDQNVEALWKKYHCQNTG